MLRSSLLASIREKSNISPTIFNKTLLEKKAG